jgi:hypothetical protein
MTSGRRLRGTETSITIDSHLGAIWCHSSETYPDAARHGISRQDTKNGAITVFLASTCQAATAPFSTSLGPVATQAERLLWANLDALRATAEDEAALTLPVAVAECVKGMSDRHGTTMWWASSTPTSTRSRSHSASARPHARNRSLSDSPPRMWSLP